MNFDDNIPRDRAENDTPAANLIRQKLEKVYTSEPGVAGEIIEAEHSAQPSKHQQFLLELNNSGKSLVEIQIAWHDYYQSLSDQEKHDVWNEFYAQHDKISHYQKYTNEDAEAPQASQPQWGQPIGIPTHQYDEYNASDNLRDHIQRKINSNSGKNKLTFAQHLKSLGFGLMIGGIFLFVMLFGLLNEKFITPFITPSRNVSATPIIIDPNGSQKVDLAPKVIIPAINVEAPVIYDLGSNLEKDIQKALENGTYHYEGTSKPGEKGNVMIFGHSSNNILNSGKYKFVFLALNKLNVGDQFVLHYQGTRYVYKIFNKRVVAPSEVNVLFESPKPNMATLITCDPPGTSNKRLLIEGEQVSPNPDANIASTTKPTEATPQILPGNAPSLWSRIINWLF